MLAMTVLWKIKWTSCCCGCCPRSLDWSLDVPCVLFAPSMVSEIDGREGANAPAASGFFCSCGFGIGKDALSERG